MSKRKHFLTIQRKDGSWIVLSSKTHRSTLIFTSKSDAWKETKRLARGSGSIAILKEKDGKISAQNSYEIDHQSIHELVAR